MGSNLGVILDPRVAWERHQSADGRDYYVYFRKGYPPLVRRSLYSPEELKRAYKNDRIVRMKP
jgi:hypothetical protein